MRLTSMCMGLILLALVSTAYAMDGWAEYGSVGADSYNGNQEAIADAEFTYSTFTDLGAEAMGDANFAYESVGGVIDTYATGATIDVSNIAIDYTSSLEAGTSVFASDEGFIGSGIDVDQYAVAEANLAEAGQSGTAYGDDPTMYTWTSSPVSYADTYADVSYGTLTGTQGALSVWGTSDAGQDMDAAGDWVALSTYAWEADGNYAGVDAYADWGDVYANQAATGSWGGWTSTAGQDVYAWGYGVSTDAYANEYGYTGGIFADVYTYNDEALVVDVQSGAIADSLNEYVQAGETAYQDGLTWFGAGSNAYSLSSSDSAWSDFYNGQISWLGTGAYADSTGFADAWVF